MPLEKPRAQENIPWSPALRSHTTFLSEAQPFAGPSCGKRGLGLRGLLSEKLRAQESLPARVAEPTFLRAPLGHLVAHQWRSLVGCGLGKETVSFRLADFSSLGLLGPHSGIGNCLHGGPLSTSTEQVHAGCPGPLEAPQCAFIIHTGVRAHGVRTPPPFGSCLRAPSYT